MVMDMNGWDLHDDGWMDGWTGYELAGSDIDTYACHDDDPIGDMKGVNQTNHFSQTYSNPNLSVLTNYAVPPSLPGMEHMSP